MREGKGWKARPAIESVSEAWQEYLLRRPLQDEASNVPLGFEVEERSDGRWRACGRWESEGREISGTNEKRVKVDRKTGQPIITFRSLQQVSTDDFKDEGPGVAMTYLFMREGSIFFFVHGVLQIPCYVLQRWDPLGTLLRRL